MRKGLSIIQPWPWAIFYAGKDVENRNWKDNNPALHTVRRLIETGDRFIIHASARMPLDEFGDCFDMVDYIHQKKPAETRHDWRSVVINQLVSGSHRGGIVGSARMIGLLKYHEGPNQYEVVGCARGDAAVERVKKACFSPWLSFCSYAFVLADAKACKLIQMKGGRGFFDVPPMLAGKALVA